MFEPQQESTHALLQHCRPVTAPIVQAASEALILRREAHLDQLADRCAADDAHLVVFDRRPHTSWEEKIFQRREVFHGRAIMVWGM